MPARKNAPLGSVEEESDAQVGATDVEVLAPKSKEADVSFSSDEVRRQKNDFARTRDALRRMPKVRIRVQEETVVQLNGYGFQIAAKTWVEVPQEIADILEEAGRI